MRLIADKHKQLYKIFISLDNLFKSRKDDFRHSHEKRKESVEGSLDRVLFGPKNTSVQATSKYIKWKH